MDRKPLDLIWVRPAGNPHAEAFRELAEALQYGLEALGIPVRLKSATEPSTEPAFVLGWHLLDAAERASLPDGSILYNLEQLDAQNAPLRDQLVQLAERFEIWDYSPRNASILRLAGLQTPIPLLAVGYAPVLTRIDAKVPRDLDVLFYGSINPRRALIIQALQARGLRVHAAFGVYGEERDALIARAKVVLNLHYYESNIFEMVRVSYLLANGKPVVAECARTTEVDKGLREGVKLVPYDRLVEACVELVADEAEQRRLGARGLEVIRALPQEKLLREAAASSPLLRDRVTAPVEQARGVLSGQAAPSAKLSVFMPNYNHGRYLRDALGAILSQSRPPDEVVVLDDCSTDDSLAILNDLASHHPNLRVERNAVNRGVMYGINWGLTHVTGDYVYFAAADDRVLPGFFEAAMGLLERHPGASQCFSYPSVMDAEGRVHEVKEGFEWGNAPRFIPPDELAGILQGRHVCGHCIIIRRQALIEAGGFPEELKWHSDWFSEMVMAFRHGVCYLPKTFALQRMMVGTYSEKGRNHWPSQRESLLGIFRRLKSPAYRDVLPFFQASNAMAHQGMDTVPALLSSPEDWDLDAFKLIRAALGQVLLHDDLMARFYPSANKAPEIAPTAFLFDPDWSSAEWAEGILSYLEAFAPGEAVGLVIPLAGLGLEADDLDHLKERILELVAATGRTAFPDVVLVETEAELLETLRRYTEIQWLPKGRGNVLGLRGPQGQRLAEARKRLQG